MKRGAVGVQLAAGTSVAAPTSGVHLGRGTAGPVSVRLFRLTGTTLSVAGSVLPAQVIALRAAAAGTPVQVVTNRPQLWQPLLPASSGRTYLVASTEQQHAVGGPSLIIDDLPTQGRGRNESRPWQCRVDIRSDWVVSDLAAFVYADLALLGPVPPALTRQVAQSFRVPQDQVERLVYLEPGVLTVLRRGRLDTVALDPSPAERAVLDLARSAGHTHPAVGSPQPAPPIWR